MVVFLQGYDIAVHREYYRRDDSTIQLTQISKALILAEKGVLNSCKGQNLDELQLPDDDEVPPEESPEDNEEEEEEEEGIVDDEFFSSDDEAHRSKGMK